MKKLIEKQFIQGETIHELSRTCLEKVDYKAVNRGFKNWLYSDGCFREKEIFLEQTICDLLYEGKELFYYPELAKQIRKLEVYPYLTKKYPVNQEKKGIDFLHYLAQYADECLQAFKIEQLEKYKKFNHLIQLYGYDRYLPLIEKFEEVTEERRCYIDQILTINGVKWYISDGGGKASIIESIDLRKLFNISGHYRNVIVVQMISGTPFLALKCCTHEYNKGHVFWYDLSTQSKTTKEFALKWKKPTWL